MEPLGLLSYLKVTQIGLIKQGIFVATYVRLHFLVKQRFGHFVVNKCKSICGSVLVLFLNSELKNSDFEVGT
jgi:hypothetical protein